MIDHTVQCNTMMKIEEAILDERRWPAGAVTVIIRFERGAATQNDKWPGSLVWTAGAGRRLGLPSPSAPHLALPCMTGSREGWLNRAPRWHSRTCTASSSDAVLSRSACPSVCLSVCWRRHAARAAVHTTQFHCYTYTCMRCVCRHVSSVCSCQ